MSRLVYITASESQDKVAVLGIFNNIIGNLLKCIKPHGTRNFSGKLRSVYIIGIDFTRTHYFGHNAMVGYAEYLCEVIHQHICARIGKRLKHRPNAVISHLHSGVNGNLELSRVVSVVIYKSNALIFAEQFKTSVSTAECIKSVTARLGVRAGIH